MIDNYEMSDQIRELAKVVLQDKQELAYITESGVLIGYMVSDKKKKSHGGIVHADCEKVKPKMRKFVPYDFIITVYLPNCEELTEEQMYLLMYHELQHVGAERREDGTLKTWIVPHDIEDFHSIVDRFGTYWSHDGMNIELEEEQL